MSLTNEIIAKLLTLTALPFEFASIKTAFVDHNGQIDYENAEDGVVEAILGDSVAPIVATIDKEHAESSCIYLPLYTTEDSYDCAAVRNRMTSPNFDHAFEVIRKQFVEAIGGPTNEGAHEFNAKRYLNAAWCGDFNLLAIIQDDFDVQFGSEISAWVVPYRADGSLPILPPHQ